MLCVLNDWQSEWDTEKGPYHWDVEKIAVFVNPVDSSLDKSIT